MARYSLAVVFLLTSLLCVSPALRGDILVGSDGRLTAGKIISATDTEIVIQPDGGDVQKPRHVVRTSLLRVVYTDEHGALLPAPAVPGQPATQPAASWDVPPEPAAPPLPKNQPTGPTYYVIPLHGEVGATILAKALEKSLADAVLRKPTVVVLDIDSPGGSVDEAMKITKVLAHYNKQLRIVVLADQDLSAAAILSLSVKEIYLKPTGTIGAATSFIPGHPDLSAKVEEKMQSAWRAVARNSAEEGGHDPLLAEAMIDNDKELHLETIDGKPVVKEGHGDKTLCRMGKILTLTSHEAVECGLAAGNAEDVAELGEQLGFAKWTECPGLGALLADYLPKRHDAFDAQLKKIVADFAVNIAEAAKSDPTQQNTFVYSLPGAGQPRGPTHVVPGRPPMPGRPMGPISHAQQQVVRTQSVADTAHWKQRSLACVLALQQSESNLHDAETLGDAFALDLFTSSVKDAMTNIGAIRTKMYEERNKYGTDDAPAAPKPEGGAVAGQANPGQHPAGNPYTLTPAETEAQLKKIDGEWQPGAKGSKDLTNAVVRGDAGRGPDGIYGLFGRRKITTNESFRPPVTFRIVAWTDRCDTRIKYADDQMIFNWEAKPTELRVDGGPANGRHKEGAGQLPSGRWFGLELVVRPDEMVVYVDGVERYRVKADFSNINDSLAIEGHSRGSLEIRSITTAQPAEPAQP